VGLLGQATAVRNSVGLVPIYRTHDDQDRIHS